MSDEALKLWQLLLRRVCLLTIGVGTVYVALLLARQGYAGAEARGVWAGVAGMVVMDLLDNIVPWGQK